MNKLFFALVGIIALVFFSACEKETVEPGDEDQLIEIASTTSTDLNMKVTLYSYEALFVGYNQLMVKLTDLDNSEVITQAEVTMMPMMEMNSGMMHSAPMEMPDDPKAVNEMFNRDVVFIMPSTVGNWMLQLTIKDQNTGKEAMLSLKNLTVVAKTETKMKSMVAMDDSANLFISLLSPNKPNVGINDFEITVHKRESMMSFPAVADYTVEIEPEMPTMGHGSPNNVNPVHAAKGHYKGKVNFTMDGYWKVNVRLKRGSELAAETSFDITF